MSTDTRPSAQALLGRLRAEELDRRGEPPHTPLARFTRVADGRRLLVAAALGLLVALLAWVLPGFAASAWIQLGLTAVVVVWCGWPFHRGAFLAAARRRVDRDTLLSAGLLLALVWSVAQVVRGGPTLLAPGALVTVAALAGRQLEAQAEAPVRTILDRLMSPVAEDVAVLRIDPRTRITGEIRIARDELVEGDQFVVRTGEIVVADGGVVDGSGTVDPSLVTGSGEPVPVAVGDPVSEGTVNTAGRLVIQAKAVGPDTLRSRVQQLVAATLEQLGHGSTKLERVAARVLPFLAPGVLLLSLVPIGLWFATGRAAHVAAAVALLVAASPATLGQAVPAVLRAALARGSRLGVLPKGMPTLDLLRRVDTVVLEQDGVVTSGRTQLRSIAVVGTLPKEAALKAAAAVEQGVARSTDDPVALALVEAAEAARIPLPAITDFTTSLGEGASARIKGTEVTVGVAALFDEVDASLREHARTHTGVTVFVGWDGTARAALTVEDPVRDSARSAVDRLRELGLTAYLVSAGADPSARAVGDQVGIEASHVRAGRSGRVPEAVVADLQREGRVVAFVSTGGAVAALGQADVGFVLRSGTEVPTEPADVVVLRPDLGGVVDSTTLARRTRAASTWNTGFALAYTAAAVVLSLTGVLQPVVAGVLGALAPVVVLTSALRLGSDGRRDRE